MCVCVGGGRVRLSTKQLTFYHNYINIEIINKLCYSQVFSSTVDDSLYIVSRKVLTYFVLLRNVILPSFAGLSFY